MKKLFNIIAIILLSALSAFTTTFYMNQNIASKQDNTDTLIREYLKNNTSDILEQIAKSKNFGETVRHFAGIDEADIIALVDRRI
jgi:hypothetical protein